MAAGANFCAECGAAVRVEGLAQEPASGLHSRPVPKDTTAPDFASADRRQAVVLFADISGYTALCSRSDPEQVETMLGAFFDAMDQVVESYGGRVFDRAGDAVMAVFGAPTAHGNDAERAIRAALAMHVAAAGLVACDGQPLSLHIGIASGEVLASVIGGGGKSKYSVTGAPVNLAARLDSLASSGETLISQALYQAVSAVVDAEALDERAVKGLAAPVAVWRVRGLRSAPVERSPFVGRHAELVQIMGALDSARDTGTGMTILIRGDAGIGKSRLVDECHARARAMGFDTPSGQVLDFGVGKGQDAIPSVLKAVLEVTAPDDDAARRSAVQRAVESGLIESDEHLFVNELLELAQPPAMKEIFDAMDNASRVRRSGETLGAVLQRAAKRRPSLVSIEDIHWGSRDLLRDLAAAALAAAQSPMILILTSRIEGDPLDKAWRAAIHGSPFLTIDLTPLRPQDARALARELVGESNCFALQCIARAEGNPLFLEQLLRAKRENETQDIPPTIQSLVLERMDRLASGDRLVLQAASVLGKRFSLESLQALVGEPQVKCDALVHADLIRPDGSDFLFAHALIQEAVYSSTLKSRRRELHRSAARCFGDAEPILLAEHLDRADDPDAAQAYLAAATLEAERNRHDSALRLAGRGIELATRAPTGSAAGNTSAGCELALLQGDVLREAGRSKDSIVAFRSALDLAEHDLQRCRAWMGIAAGHRITGDFADAMDALENAQPIAEQLDLGVECSRIHHTRGNLYFAQGNVKACDAEHRLALEHAKRCGNAECEVHALSGLGDAQYAQSRMRSALEYFRRCVDLCAGHAWIRIEGPNRCMVGHCLWYMNELGAAIEEVRRACADGEAFGVVPVRVFAQTSLSQFLTEAGRFDEAEESCMRGLALARMAESRRYESTLLVSLAEVRLQQGNPKLARQHLHEALDLANRTGLGFIGALIYARLARTATDAGERVEALAKGEALLKEPGLSHCHLWFYRDAIEASVAAELWDDVLRYADALEDFVRGEPLPWADLIVARGRALRDAALGHRGPAALTRLRQIRKDVAEAGVGWALPTIDAVLAVEPR